MKVVCLLVILFNPVVSQLTVNITTNIGTIVGYQENHVFNGKTYQINKFLGIPYAEAPVGNLRFAKPVKKNTFLQHFQATEFGPGCPQDPEQMKQWIPGTPKISEDCLSLNIFGPANTRSSPVMIWFHGGAYVIGQSSIYSGENLAGYGNVIIVTANYRLGPLGFLATDDSTSKGNYGLWDQRLVLQWVQQHIRNFGGDTQRITIFGESAGGSSSLYHALYPLNQGLFQRVIAESGVALCPWAFATKEKLGNFTRTLAKTLQCNSDDSKQMIECLRQKPYSDLIQYARVGSPDETLFRSEWVPVVDGEFLKEIPTKLFQSPSSMPSDIRRIFSNVDFLIGMNSGDGSLVTQVSLLPFIQAKSSLLTSPLDVVDNYITHSVLSDRYGSTSNTLADIVSFVYTDWDEILTDSNDTYLHKIMKIATDYEFFIPIRVTSRTHSELQDGQHKTFLFRFSHHSSYSRNVSWIPGAAHGDEIPYVFGFPVSMKKAYGYPDIIQQDEMNLSLQMMTYWTNFAKSGDPNSGGTVISQPWPEFTLPSEQYMDLDTPIPKSGTKMDATRTALWTKLLPRLLARLQQINDTLSKNHINLDSSVLDGALIG